MMLIGMMMLSTTNSFGAVKTSHFQIPKTEKIVKNTTKQDKACDCKTCKTLSKQQKKTQRKNLCTCKHCKNVQQKQQSTCKKWNHKTKGSKNHK